MMNHSTALLVGKILFSLIFVITSLMEIFKFKMLVGMAQKKKAPLPEVGMVLWILVKLFYAYSLFTRWHLTIASGLLILGLAAVSFFMHDFWKIKDMNEKMIHLIMTIRNVSIVGSVLIYWALAPLQVMA
jgi:putative oxidoreductase